MKILPLCEEMSIDEILDALGAVLYALYAKKDRTRFPEVLAAVEEIAWTLKYDYGIELAEIKSSQSAPPGEFEF